MTTSGYSYVILGRPITSPRGDEHATTYRGLLRALVERGHTALFLERDETPGADGDLVARRRGEVARYARLEELKDRFSGAVRRADLVIVGSRVPEGAAIGAWVTAEAGGRAAFHDLDTHGTLRDLAAGRHEHITPALVPRYDLYLSSAGGPTLERLERRHGAARARPLYCGVDPELHFPEPSACVWDLGLLGDHREDCDGPLERLLLEPARLLPRASFAVAGARYPASVGFPENVSRIERVPAGAHRGFYSAQRFTLDVTPRDAADAGHSPGARLFEAAACGAAIVSDGWPGIDGFFHPGEEILIARSTEDVLRLLCDMPDRARAAVGRRARRRALAEHTAAHRAEALERLTREVLDAGSRRRGGGGLGGPRGAVLRKRRCSDG
ncbi:glycosyltransferase [Sorangium sp. So ce315]|uniref:CgeB family protein n=1 Tax=Sorangium sp. So ce315 TaxID=3133299 RepID=UPI003F635EF3